MTGIYYSFGSHCIAANKLSLISSRQKCDRNQEADRHNQVCVVPVSPVEKTSLLFFNFFLESLLARRASCSLNLAPADLLVLQNWPQQTFCTGLLVMIAMQCVFFSVHVWVCVRQVCVHACVRLEVSP